MQEASGPDAELAQTAGYSLLALEALLHPRACPPAPTYTLKTPARPQPHPVQPNFHFGMPSPQLQPQQHQDQQGGSIVEAAGRQDAAVPMSADRGFLGGQQQPSANGGTAAGQQLHAGPSAALPRMSTADTASAGQAAEGPAGQLLSSHGQDENQAGPALQPESSMPTGKTCALLGCCGICRVAPLRQCRLSMIPSDAHTSQAACIKAVLSESGN